MLCTGVVCAAVGLLSPWVGRLTLFVVVVSEQEAARRRTRRKHERALKYERCGKDAAAVAQWHEFTDHLGNTAWYNYGTQETVYSKYEPGPSHTLSLPHFYCWLPTPLLSPLLTTHFRSLPTPASHSSFRFR